MNKSKIFLCGIIILITIMVLVPIGVVYSNNTISSNSINLLEKLKVNKTEVKINNENFSKIFNEYSVKLLKKSTKNDKNVCISPLSLSLALNMVANGSNGETKAQFDTFFGMDTLNLTKSLNKYVDELSYNDLKLKIANSLWVRDNIKVKQDYLENIASNFDAEIYSSPFNERTVKDINAWVKQKTNKLIDNIIDDLSSEDLMVLINSLLFESEWFDNYTEEEILNGEFKNFDKSISNIDFMKSKENFYLEGKNEIGFIKPYKNLRYSFVALLPKEDISIEEYFLDLTNNDFFNIINNKIEEDVKCEIPKFSFEYSEEFTKILSSIGLTDCFTDNADFSKMIDNKVTISEILHKTFITVNERGTKAGAVTSIKMSKCALPFEEKEVILNRPFMFAILDTQKNIPLFMGTVSKL